MHFKVEWSLLSELVSIDIASQLSGASQGLINELFDAGSLGPVPQRTRPFGKIPLYHLASLLVRLAATRKQVPSQQIEKALPLIAGAAYVQFQMAELAAGRCVQRGGTPNLNFQLWTMLNSEAGKSVFEEKLPGGPTQTRRYACFNGANVLAVDDLSEIEGCLDDWTILDAVETASQMSRGLRGTFLATHIG